MTTSIVHRNMVCRNAVSRFRHGGLTLYEDRVAEGDLMSSDDFKKRSCVPVRRGTRPLSQEKAEVSRSQVPGWALLDDGRRIERRFRFKSFAEANAFVARVSAIAEAEDHHPDIAFGWGYATISLHTHVIKGLHANDFILAGKVDDLLRGQA